MKLDIECVREVLLYLENNLAYENKRVIIYLGE